MTKKDLEAMIEKVRSNRDLLKEAFFNFNETIQKLGYQVTTEEQKIAQEAIKRMYGEIISKKTASQESPISNVLPQGSEKVVAFTLNLLKNSIEDARKAFKNLRLLSNATFATGLSLFILSAVSGLILQRETFSLVFGGLGLVAIISVFITKPKEEIQTGLSNLLQAETIFLNFYDQLHFWAPYAQDGTLEERKQASQALQDATAFALKSLQIYVEPDQKIEKRIKPNSEVDSLGYQN